MDTEQTLHRYARHFVRTAPSWMDEEDLLQEGRIALWQGRRPWTAMIDALRKSHLFYRQRDGSLAKGGEEFPTAEIWKDRAAPTTLTSLEEQCDRRRQLQLIQEESPDLLWPFFQGRSWEAIAARLGIELSWFFRRRKAEITRIQARLGQKGRA